MFFILSSHVKNLIKQKLNLKTDTSISFEHILLFCILNQTKQQGDDTFKAFKEELWSIPQGILVDILTRKDLTFNEQIEAFNVLKSTWIKQADIPARELYGKAAIERPSDIVIEDEKKQFNEFLTKTFNTLPLLKNRGYKIEEIRKQVEELASRVKEKVHPKIISPVSDDNQTLETENAKETDTETETELEVQTQNLKAPKTLESVWDFSFENCNTLTDEMIKNRKLYKFPLDTYMKQNDKFKEFSSLFEGIFIDLNVLAWEKIATTVKETDFLGPFRIPFHHLFIEGDQVHLTSSSFHYPEHTENYYNLTLGFLNKNQNLSPSAFEKVVKIKFLNGEADYTSQEIEFLEKWLKEAGSRKMLKFYKEQIADGFPEKASRFKGSKLQKVFKILIKNNLTG